MKILLDECLPARLRKFLDSYEVSTVPAQGWQGLKNGALLSHAEQDFDVFLTVDSNLQYQQTLSRYALGIVVIHARSNRLEDILPLLPLIQEALAAVENGKVIIIGV